MVAISVPLYGPAGRPLGQLSHAGKPFRGTFRHSRADFCDPVPLGEAVQLTRPMLGDSSRSELVIKRTSLTENAPNVGRITVSAAIDSVFPSPMTPSANAVITAKATREGNAWSEREAAETEGAKRREPHGILDAHSPAQNSAERAPAPISTEMKPVCGAKSFDPDLRSWTKQAFSCDSANQPRPLLWTVNAAFSAA